MFSINNKKVAVAYSKLDFAQLRQIREYFIDFNTKNTKPSYNIINSSDIIRFGEYFAGKKWFRFYLMGRLDSFAIESIQVSQHNPFVLDYKSKYNFQNLKKLLGCQKANTIDKNLILSSLQFEVFQQIMAKHSEVFDTPHKLPSFEVGQKVNLFIMFSDSNVKLILHTTQTNHTEEFWDWEGVKEVLKLIKLTTSKCCSSGTEEIVSTF